MSRQRTPSMSAARRVLENPYAYIEDVEEPDVVEAPSAAEEIRASRKILQDPYAHLDGDGGYSAESPNVAEKFPQKEALLSDHSIEHYARRLQHQLWRSSGHDNPIDVLDPIEGLRLVGYECYLEDGLGLSAGRIEIAGLIDQTRKTVHISSQFPLNVRLFTAAHELGHAVLHASHHGVHRDRPLDGASKARDLKEQQADKFAAYFLMPEKLVRARFQLAFGTHRFTLNEASASSLAGFVRADGRRQVASIRDLARALAACDRYNGRSFESLAAQFRVSIEAMAIRLQELELLAR
jgi:Zn-dependent peptidase ImmA (M78 family)